MCVSHSSGNDLTLGDQVTTDQLAPKQDAAINLPPSLFEQINDSSTVGLFFALYNDPTLFPVGEGNTDISGLKQTRVGSSVLATTVGPGISFENLEDNVTVTLRADIVEEVNNFYILQSLNYIVTVVSRNLSGVSHGTLDSKTGPLRAVLPEVLAKMVFLFVVAIILPTLLCLW